MDSMDEKMQESADSSLVLSPGGTSRYGRALRPKISDGFYSIDDVVIERSPRKSPIKSPITKSNPILFEEISNEYNKFEDLGVKVANNFKANLQRGLDDSIKERKFFKSAKIQVSSNVVDVNKVLKLISPERTEINEIFKKKLTPSKATLKTYTNKRKRFESSSNNESKIESFGLPDEPIISVTKSRKTPRINKKIDISSNENVDVNLHNPFRMENNDFIQSISVNDRGEDINDNMCEKIVSNVETRNTSSEVIVKSEVEFEIGDLVWAKIGLYPFWPCMVADEPISGLFHKFLNRRVKPSYHVRFFGDNGRRSWVTGTNVISYQNRDDLERLAAKNSNDHTMSKSQIKESFRVKTKLQKTWTIAVEEAEMAKLKTKNERIEYFCQVLAASPKRKRRTIDAIIKEELDKFEEKPEIKQEAKEPAKIHPKKRNTELSSETVLARKRLRSWNVSIKTEIIEDSPESVSLELPPPAKKAKLSEEPENNNNNNNKKIVKVESNSDTDSKFSDNSSVPNSLESQAALYKRNNIFRGVPRERVCQICEKPGNVLRCKGPCGGVFHHSCAFPTPLLAAPSEHSNVEIIGIESKEAPLPLPKTSQSLTGMTLAEKIDFRMKEIMKNCEQTLYSDPLDSSSEIQDEQQQSPAARIIAKKSVPIRKHVCADDVNYVCVDEKKNEEKAATAEAEAKIKDFKCKQCLSNKAPFCQACFREESKTGSTVRQNCSSNRCDSYYHHECLKIWPQTQWMLIHNEKKLETFLCPRHICHTCASDDPRAQNSRCGSDKVVKCLRCPATYHSSNYCVPAGTHILTTSQIICPRHFSDAEKHLKKKHFQYTINANWCFICGKGGDLVCCETCPTSVHAECGPGDELNKVERFFCDDCQSGRLPLYDEIVWVKLGKFRWWPALILFPNEIPEKIKTIAHSAGEFVVKFFGTYDHYWVGRGRTFLFQEGDQGHSNSSKRRVDHAFATAVAEATAAHILKQKFKVDKVAEKSTVLKPPHYIRIKANKPVGNVRSFDGNTSNTTSCDCSPHQPHPCGPETDCLNRLLWTECNPEVCPAGSRCNNQSFEKREYPPLVPYRTSERGWGLKTLAPIRTGQFVIEYVGELIDEQEYQRRVQRMNEQKEENYYFLTIDNTRMLDAGPKGNVARFMNHSCQPNCETQKWTVNGETRVGLFATCDIPADTELTFNYNLESIGKEKKICRCEAPNCSGFIGGKIKIKVEEGPKKKVVVKQRKKRQSLPVFEVVVQDNPCFICGKLGDVGACNNKVCTKYYHLECLGLTTWPEGGKWVCPWHNCNFCTKRTIRCCVQCVNSYCPPHSEGNVRYDKLLGFVCTEHDPLLKETAEVKVSKLSPVNSGSGNESEVTSTTTEEVSGEERKTPKSSSKKSKKRNDENLENSVKKNKKKSVKASTKSSKKKSIITANKTL